MDGFYYEFNTNFKGTVYICNNRTPFPGILILHCFPYIVKLSVCTEQN